MPVVSPVNGLAEQLELLAKRLDGGDAANKGRARHYGDLYARGYLDALYLAARLIREFIATHEERTTSPDLTVEGGPPSVPPKGAA